MIWFFVLGALGGALCVGIPFVRFAYKVKLLEMGLFLFLKEIDNAIDRFLRVGEDDELLKVKDKLEQIILKKGQDEDD